MVTTWKGRVDKIFKTVDHGIFTIRYRIQIPKVKTEENKTLAINNIEAPTVISTLIQTLLITTRKNHPKKYNTFNNIQYATTNGIIKKLTKKGRVR